MRVLVTGAGGFVGRRLALHLASGGHDVRAAVRIGTDPVRGATSQWIGDLADAPDLGPAVDGMDAVVHLAARVHAVGDQGMDAYQRINVDATRRLAEAATEAGVKRFMFISTVKVNGEATPGAPFTEEDTPAPADSYGISKWDAERMLRSIALGAMETVVIRPPLVYGPGAKANFHALLRLCDAPLPIPLGAARHNRRSMIFLDNLTSAIHTALCDPRAAGRSYFVRDGEDLSPAELVARIRRAFGRAACLVPVPRAALAMAARLIGRPDAVDRLFASLRVDDSRLRRELEWQPPFTVDQGIAATAAWFRAGKAVRPS